MSISQASRNECESVISGYDLKLKETTDITELFCGYDEKRIVDIQDYQAFVWPKTDSAFKNEKDSSDCMISYLSKYITNEKYEIKDVKEAQSFSFSVALEFLNFNGRPDAIIVPKGCKDLLLQPRICFEFKTCKTVDQSYQRRLELIASNIHAFHPVMIVQTDLTTFYLLVGYNNTVFEFKSLEAQQSLQYINYWLNNMCDSTSLFDLIANKNNPYVQMMMHCRSRYEYILELRNKFRIQTFGYCETNNKISNKENTTEENIRANKIYEAYNQNHIESKLSGRSGQVFIIEIEGKKYALKKHIHSVEDILLEMRKEKLIYKYLEEKIGNWPKLYYGGYLPDNSYAICTNYIEGQCFTKEDLNKLSELELENLKTKCTEVINAFHSVGVVHGDIRPLNFIFNNNKAYLIDFGFSRISDSKVGQKSDFDRLNSKFLKNFN